MEATRALEMRLLAANETIDWAHDVLDLSYAAIAEAIGVDRRSLARWRAREHAPSRTHRRAMEKLRVLRFLLEAVLPDEETALEWLHSSVSMLRGRSPVSLLGEGRVDEVTGVLAAMESGAAV